MVVVSAGHVGGTRGSGIVSSAADVLGMSVVRRMRGVGGMCEMYVVYVFCSGQRGRRGLGLGTGWNVGHVAVPGLRWCGWCRWVGRLNQGLEGWSGVISV